MTTSWLYKDLSQVSGAIRAAIASTAYRISVYVSAVTVTTNNDSYDVMLSVLGTKIHAVNFQFRNAPYHPREDYYFCIQV